MPKLESTVGVITIKCAGHNSHSTFPQNPWDHFFLKSHKVPIQKKFPQRTHYVEQVWSYVIIFQKIDLCDVLPPIEDLPMEENDYVTI
jgi:hypothetical protein